MATPSFPVSHPTVIMEAYHKWQWSAIFFITYLIVTLYILLNVVCFSVISSS